MNYFSMFTGCGGFELGIQQAFDRLQSKRERKGGEQTPNKRSEHNTPKQRNRQQHRPVCVGVAEIDKYASAVLKHQFPEAHNYGNAKNINPEQIPDFDLLVAGFPCQAFSVAGNRKGFNDTRGTLFFEIARIAQQKQPRFLVLENVKGLLSHDKGRTFHTILSTLDELGYDVEWQVLNSKNHGVPQNRERVFIIGRARGRGGRQVFPFVGENTEDTRRVGKDVASCLDSNYHKGTSPGDIHKQRRQQVMRVPLRFLNRNQKNIDGDYSFTVDTTNTGGVMVPEATKKGYATAKPGDSVNLKAINSKTRRGRVGNKEANTLDTGMQQHTVTQDLRIRRLTPVECERLQGFPDDWTKHGIINGERKEMSDTQRYKMMGNAVTVNVVASIIEALFKEAL